MGNSTTPSEAAADRLASLGRVLFGAGLVLITLRAIPFHERIPGVPVFWYSNQSLWIVIGLGLTALGWIVLWGRPRAREDAWQPTRRGQRFGKAVLYVGDHCHLCDDATALLLNYQKWLPPIEIVEISSDAGLNEKFCSCVPVLALDGKVRFRGRISEPLLQRLIEGTPPNAS